MIGGVICPPVEAVDSTAAAKCFLYPRRIMAGIVSDPTVTVLATDEPGDHAEQRRPEDRHLSGAAGITARHPGGVVEEKLPEADAGRKHAEEHEVEHVGRHHAERDAVDALAREVEMVDELRKGGAGMHQDSRHRWP